MPVPWRYRGRAVTAEDIVFIRQFIADNPSLSRRKLSARLCEAWQWKQANGALCDMVCRGLLLMLHRAGEIELPVIRQTSLNPFVQRNKPQPVLIDMTPLTGALIDIRPISLQQVRRTSDEPLFNSLIEHHHYLGYEQPVGEHLKYRGVGAGQTYRLHGMEFGAAPSGQPRSAHRLVCRSAAAQHSRCLSWLTTLVVTTTLRPSCLPRRNLHRSRPLSRVLLSRGELETARADYRARQGLHQQTPQPFH